MATPSESRLGASANGDLEDRVRRLRLDDQLGTGRGRTGGSWLPWVLCGLLAITWAGVGVRWYRSIGTKGEDPSGAPPGSSPAPTGPSPVERGALLLGSRQRDLLFRFRRAETHAVRSGFALFGGARLFFLRTPQIDDLGHQPSSRAWARRNDGRDVTRDA